MADADTKVETKKEALCWMVQSSDGMRLRKIPMDCVKQIYKQDSRVFTPSPPWPAAQALPLLVSEEDQHGLNCTYRLIIHSLIQTEATGHATLHLVRELNNQEATPLLHALHLA